MSKINILGFDISIIDQASLAGAVERFLHSRRQHCIVTPNPEIILKAMRDEELYFIISKADLALPDGIGLKIAALAMGKIIDRHTGADLVKTIFESAQAGGFKAAIAYWEHSISTGREIEHSVKSRWPKLELKAFKVKRQNYMKELDRPALDEIARYNPAVLITNLGAPYQEKFIYHYQRKLPSVKLAVGVGGALDFLTGKMKRAPAVMRKIGLEWLFRLIQEPHRFNRIINAVVVYVSVSKILCLAVCYLVCLALNVCAFC